MNARSRTTSIPIVTDNIKSQPEIINVRFVVTRLPNFQLFYYHSNGYLVLQTISHRFIACHETTKKYGQGKTSQSQFYVTVSIIVSDEQTLVFQLTYFLLFIYYIKLCKVLWNDVCQDDIRRFIDYMLAGVQISFIIHGDQTVY